MKIQLNGKEKEVGQETTVLQLIKQEGVQSIDTVSIQYNGAMLDKEKIEQTLLQDGDSVDFLYFMGGG